MKRVRYPSIFEKIPNYQLKFHLLTLLIIMKNCYKNLLTRFHQVNCYKNCYNF